MKNKTGHELMAICLQGEDHCHADAAGDEIYRRLRAFEGGGIVSRLKASVAHTFKYGRFRIELPGRQRRRISRHCRVEKIGE